MTDAREAAHKAKAQMDGLRAAVAKMESGEGNPPSASEQENATYTASEVKVLTETASKVAYALGRKDAAEEIAVAIADHRREFKTGSAIDTELFVAQEIALGTGSQVAGATSDATSGVPGHQEVSEADERLSKLLPTFCPTCGQSAPSAKFYRARCLDSWHAGAKEVS